MSTKTIDEYLANLSAEQRAVFEQFRTIVHAAMPEATEAIAHTIPSFMYNGHALVGFGAHDDYLGIYPFSSAAIDAVKDELQGFELSPRVIKFTVDKPLPKDALVKLLAFRMHEIAS